MTPPDASDSLSPADLPDLLARRLGWRQLFSRPTLERGLEYARTGHVEEVEVSNPRSNHFQIAAQVRGTELLPYSARVTLQRRGAQWQLTSRCDCPVGGQCKHVVALLANVESSAHDPLQEWERWIRSVEAPDALPLLPQLDGDRRLMVILRRNGQFQLTADPVWARAMKRGGWGDVRPVLSTAQGPVPKPPGGWLEPVEDALTMLLAGAGHFSYRNPVEITGRAQEQALMRLLGQATACWDKPSQILEPGPDVDLTLDWRPRDDGTQRLVPVADGAGDAALLLRGAGLWYVNLDTRRYGRVDGEPAVLDRLRNAPRLHPDQAEAVRERLRQVPRLQRLLTPPSERVPVEELRTRPTPVVELRAVHGSVGRDAEFGVGRLLFDYGAHRLPAGTDPIVRLADGDRLLDVRRHRADENAAYDALSDLHLEPADVVSGLFPDDSIGPGDHVLLRGRLPMPAAGWLPLLPRLREAGFGLEFDPRFPFELVDGEPVIEARLEPQEGQHWFDLHLDIDIGGERVNLLPVLRRLLDEPDFPLKPRDGESENAQWLLPVDGKRLVSVPLAQLRGILEPLLEWLDGPAGGLQIGAGQADVLELLTAAPGVIARGGDALVERARRLRDRPPAVDPEPGFAAELRPYQREGLAWLDALAELGAGGILADDMGLGKTVQVLAHLHGLKVRGALDRPALVVCPTSLVGNWAAETRRHAPALRVLALHGPDRANHFDTLDRYDLVISTYPLLPRDAEVLIAQRFALLVLDEAQQIKNARTQAAAVVRRLQVRRRLAMTGTPLENHLGELWAQFDAVEPGLLGSEKRFARHYRTPIEKQGDVDRRAQLLRRIAPLMLRRRKQDVLDDLPEKTEMLRSVEIEGRQRELYETLRLAQHQRVREAVASRGLSGSGIVVLDALLKLRQVCCDPRLVKLEGARRVNQSAKLELLLDMLDKLVDEGRRILVFSQFTEMLDLIAKALKKAGIEHLMLTGQTRERAALVDRFQAGEVPVFLISLKAGGTGLNLTAADTVIHYDPWWNPAVEAQATDRAHRIGQKNPVFVYRLICAGTVEEKIQQLQGAKADLARAVLDGGSTTSLRFSDDDLDALFEPVDALPADTDNAADDAPADGAVDGSVDQPFISPDP